MTTREEFAALLVDVAFPDKEGEFPAVERAMSAWDAQAADVAYLQRALAGYMNAAGEWRAKIAQVEAERDAQAAEVERLRAEVERLRAEVEALRRMLEVPRV